MTIFIYARLSTLDKNTNAQIDALKTVYPDADHYQEKKSGTSTKGREVLRLLLEIISLGDTLVVWKLDRLARDSEDLCQIVDALQEKGAYLEIIEPKIDTRTATGEPFLKMVKVFAEFEINRQKERQLAGVAGNPLGRKTLLSTEQQKELRIKRRAGKSPTELAKEYGVSRGTVYNYTFLKDL